MNQKIRNTVCLLLGVGLIIVGGFVLRDEAMKAISGVCIGIGAGLFGMSLSNSWMLRFYQNNPEELKQCEIELADERNTMIRNQAKAKTVDILQWCVMGLAFISILIKAELWVTLVIVGVFVLKNVLDVLFMHQLQAKL